MVAIGGTGSDTNSYNPNPETRLIGSLCLIYEYVDGGTLTALLRDRSRGYDLFQVRVNVCM